MKYHSVAEEETNEWAALYALGALNQQEARAFEEHLAEGCEACAANALSFQEAVGALAFAPSEATPSPAVREKLSGFLAEEGKTKAADAHFKPSVPPQFLTLRANEGEWREAAAGILVKQLFADKKAKTVTSLFKFSPGTQIPKHRHHGIEQCYVIEGDFHADDKVLGPGDFHCAMSGSTHKPVYTVNGALVLIVSTEGYEVVA